MKYAIAFALTVLSSSTFAMFCPNSFSSINVGDTLEQVQQQCGKPTSEESKEVTPPGLPQEWGFFIAPPGAPTTLKITVAFDQDKAINISVNGQSMQTTTICGAAITVGDTAASVKSACGKPNYINQSQEQQSASSNQTKVTELKYGAVTLVFENGKLKTRK